jgi:hypothetical protein
METMQVLRVDRPPPTVSRFVLESPQTLALGQLEQPGCRARHRRLGLHEFLCLSNRELSGG